MSGILKGFLSQMEEKKSNRAWMKVQELLKENDSCVITLLTTKGYDRFFQRLREENLDYRIDDSLRDAAFVTVSRKFKGVFGK